MPVAPADQPLDTLRETTIDQLIMNYGHGRLSLEAFQRRLDEAFDAQDHRALIALTSDLDLEVDSGYVERKREELQDTRDYYAVDDYADDDVEYIVDIFGGSDRSGEWVVPPELRVVAIFGGSDVDMTEARFASRVTRIRMFCLFGGTDIYVPEGVNTTVKAFSIFGGFSNKAPNVNRPDAPRLIIEGLIIFGGGDVKLKRTFRERLLDFANGLRGMFSNPQSGVEPRR